MDFPLKSLFALASILTTFLMVMPEPPLALLAMTTWGVWLYGLHDAMDWPGLQRYTNTVVGMSAFLQGFFVMMLMQDPVYPALGFVVGLIVVALRYTLGEYAQAQEAEQFALAQARRRAEKAQAKSQQPAIA